MSDLNVEDLFGDQYLDFECPGCKHQFRVRFREVSREGSVIRCPGCHRDINIAHPPDTKRAFRDANKSLEDLARTIKRLGK